jgi:hypothetical protein
MNNKARFDRQILAFGTQGQGQIEIQRIGIVGLGGLGSQVAQALSYLGVRAFVLIDDDSVEVTNLNRLIGSSSKDIGRPKVDVIADHLSSPDTIRIRKNLRSQEALKTLQTCDTIFGCVDSDGPRLILTELASAYERVYIDCASEIILDKERTHISDFGGRIVIGRPGEFCLFCARELDSVAAKIALESPQAKQVRKAHGYGLGPEYPAPSIVSINGIVANLAVTEFLVLTTGIRSPATKLTYKGMRGVVLASQDSRRPDCYNCEYLFGKGESASILRYAID